MIDRILKTLDIYKGMTYAITETNQEYIEYIENILRGAEIPYDLINEMTNSARWYCGYVRVPYDKYTDYTNDFKFGIDITYIDKKLPVDISEITDKNYIWIGFHTLGMTQSFKNCVEYCQKIIDEVSRNDLPTIVFDFDGVIHSYTSGWQDTNTILDPPVKGIRGVIQDLREDYRVVVVSTRCSETQGLEAVKKWLVKHHIEVDKVMAEKPPALVYIDDRAICFNGNTEDLVNKIKNFRSYLD